ncbi:MAG: lasso peptide biosynthesis B2 protein [Actinomycetia bacterium]|nr:lasso peptide biosynthesis B2 protein [Actinomycetes bacterium]
MLVHPKWRHRARVVEAASLTLMATAVRRSFAMPSWSRWLGTSKAPKDTFAAGTDPSCLLPSADPMERSVALAVRSAAARLPYDPRCLDRATAGQLMLRRRAQPGVVVIGLSPNKSEAWGAHAWLVGRRGVITGGREARDFAAASCFVPAGITEPLTLQQAPVPAS